MRDRSDRRGRKEEVLSWFRNFFFFFFFKLVLNLFLQHGFKSRYCFFWSEISHPYQTPPTVTEFFPKKRAGSLSSKKKKKENPTGAALSGDLRVGVKIGRVRADVILAVCDYKR